MPRGTVGRPVQERDLPALTRGCQILLQEILLPLRVRTSIAVVQFAVEGDEMCIAPVEGVVALGAARAFERWVEVLEEGGAVAPHHVVVAENREQGYSLDEVPVRDEEAAVVVALLACRVDHVACVQDQVRL